MTKHSARTSNQPQRIGRYIWLLMLGWSVAVGASLALSFYHHREAFQAEIYSRAKGIHTMDMEFRNWIIGHGGVYIPVDINTPPSPYLKDIPERDVTTPSGRTLTLLNSSYAMRQVHEMMDRHGAVVLGHITSLNPINPNNRADAWEAKALKAFGKGRKEVSGIVEMADGKRYFRFMKPMLTEKSCLKCHAQQGYKVGDIRGGISVSIPVDVPLSVENRESRALLAGHGAIWLLGLAGLFFGGRRQRQALLSVEKSGAELRLMTNSIAHAIYGQDLEGRCTFANAACVRMLGYDDESELLGRDMHALMHHTRPDGSHYPVEECPTHHSIEQSARTHVDEELFWRKDGSSFPAEYWAYPIEEEGHRHGVVVTFMDLTEKRRMRDELKESQKLLDSVIEHVPTMVFLKSADELRFELFNRAGEQMLGYKRKALLGKNDFDLFPKEQAEFFTAKDRAVLDSREVLEIPEEPIKTAEGEEKWLRTYKVGLYDDRGAPSHLLGISMDITGRVRAEADLRDSKEQYDDLVRRVPVGIYTYRFHPDGNGSFEYVSPRFCQILGVDGEEVLHDAMVAFAAACPDEQQSLIEANRRAFESQEPFRWEGRFVVNDVARWIKIESDPVLMPNGDSVWNGVVSDITERKLAELELLKSQHALAEAQKVAQLGNWELDLQNNHLEWSDEIYEIFEIDKSRFAASYEAFLEVIHPEDRLMVNEAYTRSLEQHSYYEISHRLLMPDGRIKYVQERGQSYYGPDGKPLRSVGTVQDITRMHEVEEQLRQAQKMEAVGTLVGGIAHDFNNKLAAITGNLYLAQRTIEGNDEALERLKAVEQLSFEAASMVQQLLTFARKGKVEQAPLTLVTFIKEAAKLYRVAVPESIHFTVDYGKDPLPVMGDITQLQQVFLNLLTNARDALEGVPEASIDVALLHYDPDAAFRAEHPESEGVGAYACLRVADNGCGIAPEHLEHIFDPFFTTKEQGKGTGLGLAMLYGVVQAHQGVVEVESRKGMGTTFSIYLPLHPEALEVQAGDEVQEIPHGHGELILVANDDVHVMAVFREVLESFDYKVMVAHDGKEAVELYRQHADEIALVVLDIVMPHMKGPDAARQIHAIRSDAKIIYATGYDSQGNLKGTARDAPVLEKPYRMHEVGRLIHEVLEGK
jgi:PAS domain S-box-containing protein